MGVSESMQLGGLRGIPTRPWIHRQFVVSSGVRIVQTLILVGLDLPETTEICRRVPGPVLVYETLPRIRIDRGRLGVEHPEIMNAFVPVGRVVYPRHLRG